MTENNTLKLSELIEREATPDQYKEYGVKVAKWFMEQYTTFAFQLHRPEGRLDTGEDKYMYSLEVSVAPEGDHADNYMELAHLVLSNNMDSDILSMYVANALVDELDDPDIKVIAYSKAGDNLTPLTGSQDPITNAQPVNVRVYFTKADDKDVTIDSGLNNKYGATQVVYVEDIYFTSEGVELPEPIDDGDE